MLHLDRRKEGRKEGRNVDENQGLAGKEGRRNKRGPG